MPKKNDVLNVVGLILLYLLLMPIGFLIGVASLVYGYGLEVKSWPILIVGCLATAVFQLIVKSLNKRVE